jgi:cleavage stimulation factor subunit 3
VEQLFGKAVQNGAYVPVFQSYIDFVRRRFNLTNDASGKSRETIVMAYEFVLDQVGIDTDAGKLWIDYIELQKSAPGTLGGTNWQDMQKMDTLRKLYQRAVSIPTGATLEIWRDYDRFEMGLNKVTVSCMSSTRYNTATDEHTGTQEPSRKVSVLYDRTKRHQRSGQQHHERHQQDDAT